MWVRSPVRSVASPARTKRVHYFLIEFLDRFLDFCCLAVRSFLSITTSVRIRSLIGLSTREASVFNFIKKCSFSRPLFARSLSAPVASFRRGRVLQCTLTVPATPSRYPRARALSSRRFARVSLFARFSKIPEYSYTRITAKATKVFTDSVERFFKIYKLYFLKQS